MVYVHEGWTLYTRDVKLRDRPVVTIHFFSRRAPKCGTPCDVPEGYTVGVSRRTGCPYLKRK